MLKTISYNFSSLRSCLRLNIRQDIVNVKSYGTASYPQPKLELPKISLDTEFLLNPDNLEAIRSNIKARNSEADIDKVHAMNNEGKSFEEIKTELVKCPNMSHPQVVHLTEPKICYQRDFTPPDYKIRSFDEIAKILGAARMHNLKNLCGDRTYYLTGVLAQLEQALIQGCGMNVEGERTQVYKLAPEFGPAALSGTAEMAIGGFLMGKQMKDLPLKLCAVSRCYRAEASKNVHDKGLYRVHQFYKVEMFVVTEGNTEASQTALHEILAIERQMFDDLGLAYKVLDMSPDELGDPAARKYDIEAWMPGKNFWGEISSCSDCTDYQARRLSITDDSGRFCHTVNGTACAVPRMIISLCEQHQTLNGSVNVPPVLREFLGGAEILQGKPKKLRPNLRYISSANFFDDEKVLMD